MTVAALYIDPRGPYPRMAAGEMFRELGPRGEPYCREWGPPRAIDCYDATRDARKYAGPHPVVAHPPCKHWGRLRHLAAVRCNDLCGWSGRVCDLDDGECPNCGTSKCLDWSDRECAPRAVEQVRAYGGVLEHPAGSLLWEACGLPYPERVAREAEDYVSLVTRDEHGGYTIELDQVEWGHVARKRTWLYLVGVPREALEAPPFPGREPTHWLAGFRASKGTAPKRYKSNGCAVPPGIKVCSAQQRRRTPPLFAEYLVRLARAVRK